MHLRKHLVLGLSIGSVAIAEAAVEQTEVVAYKPELSKNEEVKSGSCWTQSIAVSRAGAWRCTVGNEIHDPCFTTAESKEELVCGADPVSGAVGFGLKLTKPLPKAEGEPAAGSPWILQLENGSVCRPYTGTMPVTDKGGVSYYCELPGDKSGGDGTCDTGLLADSLTKGTVWTVRQVTFCQSSKSQTGVAARDVLRVSVKKVWE